MRHRQRRKATGRRQVPRGPSSGLGTEVRPGSKKAAMEPEGCPGTWEASTASLKRERQRVSPRLRHCVRQLWQQRRSRRVPGVCGDVPGATYRPCSYTNSPSRADEWDEEMPAPRSERPDRARPTRPQPVAPRDPGRRTHRRGRQRRATAAEPAERARQGAAQRPSMSKAKAPTCQLRAWSSACDEAESGLEENARCLQARATARHTARAAYRPMPGAPRHPKTRVMEK